MRKKESLIDSTENIVTKKKHESIRVIKNMTTLQTAGQRRKYSAYKTFFFFGNIKTWNIFIKCKICVRDLVLWKKPFYIQGLWVLGWQRRRGARLLSLSRLLADGSPWYSGTKERNERWPPMAMAMATATSTVAALDFRRHAAK